MIKRETIKQAIDAISSRDHEIGYALDEMLGMGKIDVPAPPQETMLEDDFYFFFDDRKARVSKFLYINKGNAPIEERLLVKYGELLRRQELAEKGEFTNSPRIERDIRIAGLRLMVLHEIDYAVSRLKQQLKDLGAAADPPDRPVKHEVPALRNIFAAKGEVELKQRLISFLEQLKRDSRPLSISTHKHHPEVIYKGLVGADVPAFFTHFPFCLDSLIQVADINIEFFHVRFLLNRLIRNQWQNLFACVVENKIFGIIYLDFKKQVFYRNLEIEFVATIRDKSGRPSRDRQSSLKGVGTFLVAGTWLYWQTRLTDAKELLLDSEIAARRFYASLGFQSRGLSEFVLITPGGYLLKAIIVMTRHCPHLDKRTRVEIKKHLIKHIKSLRKTVKSQKGISGRNTTIDTLRECLKPGCHPDLVETTLQCLNKYKKKIPEADELLRYAAEHHFSKGTEKDIRHETGLGDKG